MTCARRAGMFACFIRVIVAACGKASNHLPILLLWFAAQVFMEMKSMFTRLQTFKLGYQYQAFLYGPQYELYRQICLSLLNRCCVSSPLLVLQKTVMKKQQTRMLSKELESHA